MEINNLNYEEHCEYYNLYLDSNTSLSNIINQNTQKYNFEYNPEKYYQQNDDLNTRNIYENSGIIIMLNSIIQKNIYGYCFVTKQKYLCEKMYFCNNLNNTKYYFYEYHFNCSSEDYFIIHFSWEYFSPIYIYYPNKSKTYNINYRYNNIDKFVNEYIHHSTPKNNFVNVQPNYVSYAIGIMHNSGHYFWNEIMGLMFIIENNLLDNIDEFLIYKYDYLNIGEILKNKYNKNVTYLNNDNNHNATCNVTKHFVNNSLIDTFKKFYELKYTCDNSNEINILFDIRTNSRIWLNQKENILYIIHRLKEKYPEYKIKFYISGFYKHEHNEFSDAYSYYEEIQKQNDIFNSIQNNLDFKIFSLINLNLSEILKITEKIDLVIANAGSGISVFYSIIFFNKPVLCLTNKDSIIPFYSQHGAFEHRATNSIYIEPSDILYETYGNFQINIESIFYKIIVIIDKFISNKK